MKRVALVLALVAIALIVAWNVDYARDRMLRAVTEAERRVTARGAASPTHPLPAAATTIYAHRGVVRAGLPENSAAAIAAAPALHPFLEIDVFFDRDGLPYVGHYAHTDPQQRVPFDRFAREELGKFEAVLLDVKTARDDGQEVVDRFCNAIPRDTRTRITVLSLSGVFLTRLRRQRPELGTACESYLPLASKLAGFSAVSLYIGNVNTTRDALARRLGLERIYWTAFDAGMLARLKAWQPEGLIADFTRELRVEDVKTR